MYMLTFASCLDDLKGTLVKRGVPKSCFTVIELVSGDAMWFSSLEMPRYSSH